MNFGAWFEIAFSIIAIAILLLIIALICSEKARRKAYMSLGDEGRKKVGKAVGTVAKALDDALKKPTQLYDVYISYSTADKRQAEDFCNILKARGLSVKFGLENIPSGTNVGEETAKAISGSRVFIPIITEASIHSRLFETEVMFANSEAKRRSKIIFPIVLSDNLNVLDDKFKYLFSRYRINLAGNAEKLEENANKIADYIIMKKEESVMFDKLSEYTKVGLNDKAAEILCKIIKMLCEKIKMEGIKDEDALSLFSYTERLAKLCVFDYTDERKRIAELTHSTLTEILSVINAKHLNKNAVQVSVAVRLLKIIADIDRALHDIIMDGVASDGKTVTNQPMYDYAGIQEVYWLKYNDLVSEDLSGYDEQIGKFIKRSREYSFGGIELKKSQTKPVDGKNDDLLKSVASFMNEGNKILDIIGEQKPAKDFIKCLITSYERLKAYSEVVGAKEICGECIDKIAELKQRLTRVSEDAKHDETAETGIKSLLGLAIPKMGEYDVFISHKREDFDLALDMYEFLKTNFKEGFFDKFSLPEMSNSDYRDAILQALDGSRHFVVIFSNLDYLESEWVKLEMKIFHAEIDENRKDGNFIMVVTNDVYDKIMESKKSVLPIAYRRCEIIKFEDYKKVLLSYLK